MRETPNVKHKLRGSGNHAKPAFSQAAKIVAKFGSEPKLAAAIGVARTTPYKWQYSRPAGTDGLVPAPMIAVIQAAAKRLGIELTADDWAIEPSRKRR